VQAIEVITADVFPTGTRINVAEGLAGVVIAGDANVAVTGSRINVTEGLAGVQIKGDANVTVTGRQLNITIGNEDISADANVTCHRMLRINLVSGSINLCCWL
jgi:HSP20 family molecular chaperone IbpA